MAAAISPEEEKTRFGILCTLRIFLQLNQSATWDAKHSFGIRSYFCTICNLLIIETLNFLECINFRIVSSPQQLAKNLFLSGRRTPWRKAEEALITLMLEHFMTKRRIYEIYLNVIEWGNGVFGAEAAARHHFGVSAAQLGPAQAARLAAMVPNPRFYDKNRAARGLQRKTSIILSRIDDVDVP